MPDNGSNPVPRKRRRLWRLLLLDTILLVLTGASWWYLTSDAFNALVRSRVTAAISRATGGRASVGSITWSLRKLEFELRDFTIHGTEPVGEEPLLHVEHLLVDAKVLSLVRGEFGFRLVKAERLTIHVMAFADGTTNLPHPVGQVGNPLAELFRLAIDRILVSDGLFLWNHRPIPLEMTAHNLQMQVAYVAPAQRYDGSLQAERLETRLRGTPLPVSRAELGFSALPTSVQINSFHLLSGPSRVEGSGEIKNFADPEVSLSYRGALDLRQAGAVMKEPHLRGGTLQFTGTGTFRPAGYKVEGKATLLQGELAMGAVRVAGIDGGSVYSLTQDRLDVRNLFAHALGGTVTGEVRVDNWSSDAGPRSSPQQRGSAHLDVRNVQLAAAARAAVWPGLRLDLLHPAGTAGGAVAVEWKGSAAASVTTLDLQALPAATPGPDQLPLTGHFLATYLAVPSSLEIRELDLATRSSRARASGTVGRSTVDLKLVLASADIKEIHSFLAAVGRPQKLPVESLAAASFNGTLSGPTGGPAVAGHLQLSDFTTLLDVPTAALASPQAAVKPPRARVALPPPLPRRQWRTHWDRAGADLVLSPAQATVRNLSLERGATRISLTGQASLAHYTFTDYSPFTARISLRNAEVGEWVRPMGIGLGGRANLSLDASGTVADPRATGRLQLDGGRIGRESIRTLTANLRVESHRAEFSGIVLTADAGSITGTANYNLESKAIRLDLRGSAIDLARLQVLQSPRASVSGRANFELQGSGTLAEPALNGGLRMEDLVINGEHVGNVALDAVTQGEEMRLAGSTRFQTAALLLNGTVQLRGDFPAQLHLTISHFDIDGLLRAYLDGKVNGHSAIAGDVRVQGPLRHPSQFNVTAELTQLSAEIENLKLENDGPVRFTVVNRQLRLDQLHIVGDDTDLSASGTVALGGAHQLNASAQGRLNLQAIQKVNPAFLSSGRVALTVHAGGTVEHPSLDGRMQIADGAVSHIDLPNGLSGINGTLVFDQDRLTVEKLSARTGGGAIDLGGSVTFGRELDLNLTASGRDIRLRYPPGVSSTANIDLRLTGKARNALLAGDVSVTRFGVAPQFDFSLYFAQARQSPSLSPASSLLNNLHLEVHIQSTGGLQVQTSLARLSGDVDLRLRGTAIRPIILGRVNIARGDIYFNGTQYHLERGDISFANPTRTEPILNVDATARVRSYDVTLGLHGPMENLRTNYRSDPPLAEADIITLLAFGRTRGETPGSPQATANFTETASNAILSQAMNAVVSNRVQRLFGVSRIKIDPQVGSATSNPTARVTIEQQVSNNITLTYITDVTQSQQQVIQMEYNVNRNVSVVAMRDQYGVVSVDVRIRQRKR